MIVFAEGIVNRFLPSQSLSSMQARSLTILLLGACCHQLFCCMAPECHQLAATNHPCCSKQKSDSLSPTLFCCENCNWSTHAVTLAGDTTVTHQHPLPQKSQGWKFFWFFFEIAHNHMVSQLLPVCLFLLVHDSVAGSTESVHASEFPCLPHCLDNKNWPTSGTKL